MNALIEVLNKLSSQIPVEWDRWAKTEQYPAHYSVYGWIKRKDGQRDFVCVEMWEYNRPCDAPFVTSSAKYSSKICEIITGEVTKHSPCRKISELLPDRP